jgi:hypothetical protein
MSDNYQFLNEGNTRRRYSEQRWGSERFGCCEQCHEKKTGVYTIETTEHKYDDDDGKESWTHAGGGIRFLCVECTKQRKRQKVTV